MLYDNVKKIRMDKLFIEEDDDYVDEAKIEEKDDNNNNTEVKDEERHLELRIEKDDMITCFLPMKYQQKILNEMLENDGLWIIGRGLGWNNIGSNFLYILSLQAIIKNQENQEVKKRGLIFVLNFDSEEVNFFFEDLNRLYWIDNEDFINPNIYNVSSETFSIAERQKIYNKGGIVFITSQILVVDLLSKTLLPENITGMLVLNAEKLNATSIEVLIINFYRDGNDWGFLKLLSDRPDCFFGFMALDSKVKLFRIQKIFLWPRFHVDVSDSLATLTDKDSEQKTAETGYVTEIKVKMSFRMKKIQSALLFCIQACVQELKRHNPTLASDYWDIENVHDSDFVEIIRSTVKFQWYRLSYTSKQLIHDLNVLVNLLNYLVNHDSLSFYQVIQDLIDQSIKHITQSSSKTVFISPWLNLDESNIVISYARERSLGIIKTTNIESNLETKKITESDDITFKDTNKNDISKISKEYLLEDLPKWNELACLIDNIILKSDSEEQGLILIMCSSTYVVKQLLSILKLRKKCLNFNRFDFKRYMIRKLNEYLIWKNYNKVKKEVISSFGLNEPHTKPSSDDKNFNHSEKLVTSNTFKSETLNTKRRRTRGASFTARVQRLYSAQSKEDFLTPIDIDNEILDFLQSENTNSNIKNEESSEKHSVTKEFKEITFNDKLIIIHKYKKKMSDFFLLNLAPSHIIMYEPEISFIRKIEFYQAINKDNPAHVFFMYYDDSVEEHKYLNIIKKEKDCFTKLIRERSNLKRHYLGINDKFKSQLVEEQTINTRNADTFINDVDKNYNIIVDKREFRSALPSFLYQYGINIIPCMLKVGDYILSSKICVERKSINDLISSLNSGRLYRQCEQMSRSYEIPILLIEFDELKSFTFDSFSETNFQKNKPTNPVTTLSFQQNIQQKLMSLLMCFTNLKLIWSSSPLESAKIFHDLKKTHDEPNLDINTNSSNIYYHQNLSSNLFNNDTIDFIQSLPGITFSNYSKIVNNISNLRELVNLDRNAIKDLIGDENGNILFNFINKTL